MISLHYHKSYDLPVIILRVFNILGPGLPPSLACSAFARQIALAEARLGPSTITTGQLQSRRDFTDVRDVIRAYALAAEKGRVGSVYNVCSGKAVKIQKCLNELISHSRVPLQLAHNPAQLQKNDVPLQVGSARRLQNETDWKPKIKLSKSLLDLLEYWRETIKPELKTEK
jgi:GDP-4-dehydro-6-deoxy-D-mannose reductase